MSTEKQLVICMCHTRGFIQTYFLFNLLLFVKKSIFRGYLKAALRSYFKCFIQSFLRTDFNWMKINFSFFSIS